MSPAAPAIDRANRRQRRRRVLGQVEAGRGLGLSASWLGPGIWLGRREPEKSERRRRLDWSRPAEEEEELSWWWEWLELAAGAIASSGPMPPDAGLFGRQPEQGAWPAGIAHISAPGGAPSTSGDRRRSTGGRGARRTLSPGAISNQNVVVFGSPSSWGPPGGACNEYDYVNRLASQLGDTSRRKVVVGFGGGERVATKAPSTGCETC